jgi:pyruvate/2-oxoglutarate dehydrogenase complex dihydrolipoamide dehydrogenase (E3) component
LARVAHSSHPRMVTIGGTIIKNYHLVVIGAGSGGLVSAVGSAGLGVKVALIEKNKMGGDCLNTGCVPSKAIIRTAKLVHDARTAQRFGLSNLEPDVQLSQVMASVREAREKLARHDSVERMRSLGIDVYQGPFQFTSPHEVTNGTDVLQAKRFVMATGAAPFVPLLEGLESIDYLTSDTVWNLTELPKKLVVLGGGPIGSELAQVFARLGSHVTIVEMGDCVLSREDPEAACLVKDRFEAEGMRVLVNSRASKVISGPQGSILEVIPQQNGNPIHVDFDQLLVAVGRVPHVEGLGLDNAGVAYSKKGIVVDDTLRTTAKHIYACGDVVGPYQFTHTADFQARLIIRNAFFPGRSKINYRVVPWCTFTDPEVARVGLNEKDAQAQGVSYDAYTYDLKDLDRAVCDRENEGFIKVLTKKGKDQILGVTFVGPHGGDLLHELALAMHQNIGLKKLANMIHVYPTLAEASKRLIDTYQRTRLTDTSRKWLKRYLRWRFGR